ncbi:hypothetical protein Q8F55_008541 [Vanrija albida]|uniref:HNH nuclease domain-containing protein n=1 Tax=Vanrija albida TaxID=181172 RepID=A0ABR3PR89_9TREE
MTIRVKNEFGEVIPPNKMRMRLTHIVLPFKQVYGRSNMRRTGYRPTKGYALERGYYGRANVWYSGGRDLARSVAARNAWASPSPGDQEIQHRDYQCWNALELNEEVEAAPFPGSDADVEGL